MATETSSNPDDTEIFQQLELYSWDQDGEYQVGLHAILGQANDASQIKDLTHRAQVFYLARKKNIPIDFDAYQAYLSTKSGVASKLSSTSNSTSTIAIPTPLSTKAEAEIEASAPSFEELRTPSGAIPARKSGLTAYPSDPTTPKPTEAPYPPTFAEIVALITSGAPIPGIKDIPPTLVPEKATKPVAKKRRKPWEMNVPEEVVQGSAEGTFGDRRDEIIVQELPE